MRSINANHNLWFKRPYCSSKDGPSHCAQHQRQLQPNTASGYPFSQEIPLGISADTSQQPCLSLWFTTTGCKTIPAKTALIVRSINANYNPTLHQATPFRRTSLSAFLLIRHSSLVSAFDSPPPDLKLFQQRRLSLCAASTPTTTQHCIRPPLFAGSPCLHFC